MKDLKDIPRKAYSPAETARVLGVSKELVYKEIAAGHIRHSRLGNRILISAAVLDELCEVTV